MLIDAHSHLDKYGENIHSVLEEIAKHRILTISNSSDLHSYRRNLELAAMSKFVLPSFGIHPWKAPDYVDGLQELKPFINTSPLIGEIGLDYHWVEDSSKYPAQRKVLEFFLASVKEQNKIANLHTKGAEEEILLLLDNYAIKRAIIHWYSGPLDTLDKLVNRGYYFTIGIEVLYSDHIKNIARRIPKVQLLTEMDNPGGAEWLNGNLGMPSMILQVVQVLAGLLQTTQTDVVETVQTNFLNLIRGNPGLADIYSMIVNEETRLGRIAIH